MEIEFDTIEYFLSRLKKIRKSNGYVRLIFTIGLSKVTLRLADSDNTRTEGTCMRISRKTKIHNNNCEQKIISGKPLPAHIYTQQFSQDSTVTSVIGRLLRQNANDH